MTTIPSFREARASIAPAIAWVGPTSPVTRRLGGYREIAVPEDLRTFVDSVWIYARPERGGGRIPGRGHRVLPDPGLSLCFQCRRDWRGVIVDADVTIMGPVRSFRFFDPPPGLHLEAIRLKPEWSHELLSVDPAEFADAQRPIASNRSGRWARLRDRLAGTTGSIDAVAILVDEIRERVRSSRALSRRDLVHAALERIRMNDSTTSFGDVARELSASERHVRRLIRERVGIGPKYLQRVERLNRVVAHADRVAKPDWAGLAIDAGYYDQSHLIAETRALTARSPVELHAERRMQEPV